MKQNQNMWSCHLNFALKLDEEKSNMWSSHLHFALKLDEEKSKHVILSPEFCTAIG
jgi:hypothetical protein